MPPWLSGIVQGRESSPTAHRDDGAWRLEEDLAPYARIWPARGAVHAGSMAPSSRACSVSRPNQRGPMRIVVSGSTGLIGRHVVTALGEEGHSVVALTRGDRSVKGAEVVSWDPRDGVPPRALEGATAVINLAGANIGAHRWSARQREAFLSSRLDTTRACVQALGGPGPTILVNARAVGFFGTTNAPGGETAPAGPLPWWSRPSPPTRWWWACPARSSPDPDRGRPGRPRTSRTP